MRKTMTTTPTPIDDYYENEDYGDEGDYDDDYEEDEDQVAYIDDEGRFYVDEETINAADEMLTYDDEECAAILTTYTEARGALAKARIARGIYPVVAPADSGMQPRFGRTGGKGKGKRERFISAKSKAKGSKLPQWGRPDRPGDAKGSGKGGRPPPICFRCGKKGHISANCINAPTDKRKKATDSADVIIDMSPWADDFAQWRRAQSELASASAETASGLASDVDAYADAADAETEPDRPNVEREPDRPDVQAKDEEINGLEETKGCAILDSGATIMCSSTIAAEGIQMGSGRTNLNFMADFLSDPVINQESTNIY